MEQSLRAYQLAWICINTSQGCFMQEVFTSTELGESIAWVQLVELLAHASDCGPDGMVADLPNFRPGPAAEDISIPRQSEFVFDGFGTMLISLLPVLRHTFRHPNTCACLDRDMNRKSNVAAQWQHPWA